MAARVGLVLAVVLTLAGVFYLLSRPSPPSSSSSSGAPAQTPADDPASVLTRPSAESDIERQMQKARELLADGALIAPAGANAVEVYLGVLARDPEHPAARAALVEMQPVVADGIRGALAGADWSEAERLLVLLGRLDPASVLREPLADELQRRRQQAAAEAQAALNAPSTLVPATPTPASTASAPAREVVETTTATTAAPPLPLPETVAPPEPAPLPVPTPAVTAAAVLEQPARLLNNPPLVYPPQAKRQRIEGWVEVEVQISDSGNVTGVRVIRAEPPGVFDREALRTAQRWRFAPRELDGRAVSSVARRRVNFSLGS